MFRSLQDFQAAWSHESGNTARLLEALTDASLRQPVEPGGRTLGRIAWHIVLTLGEMSKQAGLSFQAPAENAPQPPAALLASEYRRTAAALGEAVAAQWQDAMLADEIPMYGETWTRGATLDALIKHEAHHRGQLTVLMRQAGLKVPGVYGPAREEWAQYGMPAQE